jgi:hypothetical protein
MTMPGKRQKRDGSSRRVMGLAGGLLGTVLLASWPVATGQPAKEEPKPSQTIQATPAVSGTVTDADITAFINEQIKQGWQANKITPSKVAGDAEFLRRAYLDIIGRIPTVEEIKAYEQLSTRTRRTDLIERLMQDDDYPVNWANHWTVWLLTRTSPNGIDREAMRDWLALSFANNKSYDKMVEDLLTAEGSCGGADANGATNFIASHVGERNPQPKQARDGIYEMVPITSRTTRLFLGIQVQCAQCHDHPFIDERKQEHFWGINAFFRQIERDEVGQGRRATPGSFMAIRDNPGANPPGTIFYENRKGLVFNITPTYLDGKEIPVGSQINRRKELARKITHDPNFARAFVNRMWAHFMGRGIVHPFDDFNDFNPPSHPELLDRLARDFTASGYDQRRLIRWICNSQPYQLSSIANSTNTKPDTDPFFSRMLLKSMSPEQLVDSIFTATNAQRTKSSREERQRTYEEWLRDFTVNFGDDEGNEATFNGTVVQALLLMNGARLNSAVKSVPGSTVNKAMTYNPLLPMQAPRSYSHEGRLNYLYLSALTRYPTSEEVDLIYRRLLATTSRDKDPTAPWEDIFWSLLNSNEFILNH